VEEVVEEVQEVPPTTVDTLLLLQWTPTYTYSG
jgi:hypothetical protein